MKMYAGFAEVTKSKLETAILAEFDIEDMPDRHQEAVKDSSPKMRMKVVDIYPTYVYVGIDKNRENNKTVLTLESTLNDVWSVRPIGIYDKYEDARVGLEEDLKKVDRKDLFNKILGPKWNYYRNDR